MTENFFELKNRPYANHEPQDRGVVRFTRSWHQHPSMHEGVWYHGVNLGMMAEYLFLPKLIERIGEKDRETGT